MRVVSFDSTGTLLRLRARIGSTYVAHYDRVASSLAGSQSLSSSRREAFEKQVDARFPSAFRSQMQQFPNFGRDGDGAATAEPWWSRVILEALPPELVAALPGDQQQRLASELYAHYASGDAWAAYDDVRPTLEAIRRKSEKSGVLTAVISDFDERLPAILRDVELLPFFDVVTTSWDARHAKPAPEIFAYTHQALQAAAGLGEDALALSEWLHVGDHAARDYGGATAFGVHARLLARAGPPQSHSGGTSASTPDVISSLEELVPLVGRRPL